jgi:hypothetical protein
MKYFFRNLFFLTLVLSVVFTVVPSHAHAIGGMSTTFGGRVLAIIPCTCGPIPGSVLHVIGAPSYANMLYVPGMTRTYRNYMVNVPSRWVLGTSLPFGQCWLGVPPFCVPLPMPMGTMAHVGTS